LGRVSIPIQRHLGAREKDTLVGYRQTAAVGAKQSRRDGTLQHGKDIEGLEGAIGARLVRSDGSGTTPTLVEAVENRVGRVEGQPGRLGAAVSLLADLGERGAHEVERSDGMVIVRRGKDDLGRRGRREEERDELLVVQHFVSLSLSVLGREKRMTDKLASPGVLMREKNQGKKNQFPEKRSDGGGGGWFIILKILDPLFPPFASAPVSQVPNPTRPNPRRKEENRQTVNTGKALN